MKKPRKPEPTLAQLRAQCDSLIRKERDHQADLLRRAMKWVYASRVQNENWEEMIRDYENSLPVEL